MFLLHGLANFMFPLKIALHVMSSDFIKEGFVASYKDYKTNKTNGDWTARHANQTYF